MQKSYRNFYSVPTLLQYVFQTVLEPTLFELFILVFNSKNLGITQHIFFVNILAVPLQIFSKYV